MKLLQASRFHVQPVRVKLAVMGLVAGLYLVVFAFVNQFTDYASAAVLVFLPAILVGLWYGTLIGAVYAILLGTITSLLGVVNHNTSVSLTAILGGDILLVLCGAGSGWIREQFASRDQMQHDLQLSEARLRSIVTGAPVILFALDQNGVFTFSEGNALSGLGLKPGEAVGRSVVDLFPEAKDF
ncbi:MAG TPA: PAS domain S-box protein, partial [Terriglobales bacterium]|nr:PAS domain S-box protein [Terriglobales bacterium]